MMMQKKYLFLSFFGHSLIIVSAFFYFKIKTNNPESNTSVATYIYSTATKSSTAENHHRVSEQKRIVDKGALAPHSLQSQKATANQVASIESKAQIYQEHNLSSNRNKTILQILHSAIAARQTYPDASIELKESGTVKLGFLLSPDGELTHVSIIQSSGFPNIDAAAVNAVNASSPVKTVGSYLQRQEYFTVDVVFK